MGRPAWQVNWQAEEELAIPEFLMKATDGSRKLAAEMLKVCNLNSYG